MYMGQNSNILEPNEPGSMNILFEDSCLERSKNEEVEKTSSNNIECFDEKSLDSVKNPTVQDDVKFLFKDIPFDAIKCVENSIPPYENKNQITPEYFPTNKTAKLPPISIVTPSELFLFKTLLKCRNFDLTTMSTGLNSETSNDNENMTNPSTFFKFPNQYLCSEYTYDFRMRKVSPELKISHAIKNINAIE